METIIFSFPLHASVWDLSTHAVSDSKIPVSPAHLSTCLPSKPQSSLSRPPAELTVCSLASTFAHRHSIQS